MLIRIRMLDRESVRRRHVTHHRPLARLAFAGLPEIEPSRGHSNAVFRNVDSGGGGLICKPASGGRHPGNHPNRSNNADAVQTHERAPEDDKTIPVAQVPASWEIIVLRTDDTR